MATKTAENVVCLQIFGSLAGKDTMNDFYYQLDHPATHTELVEMVGSAADVVEEGWLGDLPVNWVGRSVFAFDMTTPTGANAVSDAIVGLVGTGLGTPQPNNVTFAIARKNGLRGRSGNGRVFWQGIPGGYMEDANHISAAYANDLVAQIQTLDAAMSALGADPVILSYQQDGVVSSAATIYPLFDWVATNLVVDTRRKRVPKA